MGLVNCNQLCLNKEEEEKIDVINYKANLNEPNDNFDLKTLKNDRSISKFKSKFEKKLPLIGRYISICEFESFIPEFARNYITENLLDISQYISQYKTTYEIKPVEFKNNNIYRGNWNEKIEMEGYGQYYLKEEKVLAEGVWKGGFLVFARVFLPNGDIYEGGFQNSVFNGKGKLVTRSGEIYEGDFLNGEKTGECNYLFPDGTVYKGRIINGLFNGQGDIKWSNGVEYYGHFEHSTLNGFGILKNLDGERYEGNFEKNQFNGKGKFIFENGDIYEGEFESGKKKGIGIYKRLDGLIFEGEWLNDLPHGIGKIAYKENIIKCSWINGEIIEKTILRKYKEDEYLFDNYLEFKPEESFFYARVLSHLDYENNQFSQFDAGIMPSFLDD